MESVVTIANAINQQDWILFQGPPYRWVYFNDAAMLSAVANAPESEPGFTWAQARRMRGVAVYVTHTPISTDELLTYITWH